MRDKKKLLAVSAFATAAVAGIHIYNRLAFLYSTMKGRLAGVTDSSYQWRFGKVCYSVKGEGSPLLLVHHLDFDASSWEWQSIVDELAKNHKVYQLDLLGCGSSDKPKLTYTNYLYVQLINDFIKDIIKGKTDVMTSGNASSLAVMACFVEPTLYNRLVFIHPESISETKRIPGGNHKALKHIIEMPLAGTFIYNLISSKRALARKSENIYFGNFGGMDPDAQESIVDSMNEAAHLYGASARYLYASLRSHFSSIYIGNALKQLNHSIFIIGSDEKDSQTALDEYKALNPAVETSVVHGGKMLMHMEKIDEVMELCHIFLD